MTHPGKMPPQVYECGLDNCPGTVGTSHPRASCPAVTAPRVYTADNLTDEQIRELRDSLSIGSADRELLTAGLVPGDCPICGSEGDEACRSGKRGAPEMERWHWQRSHLDKPRKAARARCAEILNARAKAVQP